MYETEIGCIAQAEALGRVIVLSRNAARFYYSGWVGHYKKKRAGWKCDVYLRMISQKKIKAIVEPKQHRIVLKRFFYVILMEKNDLNASCFVSGS